MKKTFYLIILFLFFFSGLVYADSVDDVLDYNMKKNISSAFDIADTEFDALEVIDKLNHGEFDISKKNIFENLKKAITSGFKENFGFILRFFVLILLSALIENIQVYSKTDKTVNMVAVSFVILGLISVTYEIAEY